MRRIIGIVLTAFMFANTLTYAENDAIWAEYFYDGEKLKIAGSTEPGPDALIELIIKNDLNEEIYKDVSVWET